MTRVEELLLVWQDRTISTEEVAELKGLLGCVENRAVAAREFFLTGVVLESLHMQQAEDGIVEPVLSEEQAAIVQRKARPLPYVRGSLLALGVSFLVVCLAMVWILRHQPEAPAPGPKPSPLPLFGQVEQIQGETFVVSHREKHPATRGQIIAPGDGITTEGAQSEAIVNMDDTLRLTLGGDTTVFTSSDRAQPFETKLMFEKGELHIDVNRSLKRKKTTIQTPLGSVTAEAEETSLHLSEWAGVVVVRGETDFQHKVTGKSIRLQAGQYLAVDSAGELYASRVFSGNSELWTTFPRTGLNTTALGTSLAFSPAGKLAAVHRTGEGGGRWGALQDREPVDFKGERCVQFSPAGDFLATADQSDVLIYEATDLARPRILAGKDRKSRVQCLAFSPDGKSLAIGRVAVKDAARLEIWDFKTGIPRHISRDHLGTINALAFSPDGKFLASAGMDKTTILWDMESLTETNRIVVNPGQVVWSLAFSPAGEVLAIASGPGDFRVREDSEVTLWDFAADKIVKRLHGHGRAVTSVIFSGDGQTLITGSADTTVRFWDRSSARQYGMFKGHKAAPGFEALALALSTDGCALVTASFDQTVRVWPTTWIRVVPSAHLSIPLKQLASRGGPR